jgi:hypothetical protein
VTEATTSATACPYCGNPVVLIGQVSQDLRPDLVVPFRLTKAQAVAALKGHVKGKPLVPKVFKDRQHIESIQGVYAPFWLFDASAHADFKFSATQTRSWSDSDYTYTETKNYELTRVGDVEFTGLPVDASTKLDDTYMQSIEPFDLGGAQAFSMAYLSGFVADRYDVDAGRSQRTANARINNTVQTLVDRSVVAFPSTSVKRQAVTLNGVNANYALLPVWMLATKYKDKIYTFAMNGQTGKFVGDLPTSGGLTAAWFFGITVPVAAILSLLAVILL